MTHPVSSIYLNGLWVGRVNRQSGCGIISKSLIDSAGPIAGGGGGGGVSGNISRVRGRICTAWWDGCNGFIRWTIGLYTCPLLKELGSAQMLFLFVLIDCKWCLLHKETRLLPSILTTN